MASCSRTEEDVVATLTLSKQNLDDLAKPSQTLYFANNASDRNYVLIQLDKDILEEIENGEELVIRGDVGDSAVLCTSDKTYDIKKAKISNTLLLVPECTVPGKDESLTSEGGDDEKENDVEGRVTLLHREIVGWASDYLELKRMHPQINRIRKLLDENPYEGPEKEENSNKKKYTMSELLDQIQASEGELVNALLKMGICCINGYWRVLDFGYIVDCMGEICNVIDSESWNVFKVPLHALCEKVNDSGELVPDFIVRHLIEYYGSRASVDSESDEMYYELGEKKLCCFFAKMLLRDVGKFNLSEFLQVWRQSVPDGIIPDLKYLRGLAIVDKNTKPATIQYFSVDSLPQDAANRFDRLFETRAKWTREEIEPYIENLCLEGQSVSSLVTKYTRSSTLRGTKVLCSRKSLR